MHGIAPPFPVRKRSNRGAAEVSLDVSGTHLRSWRDGAFGRKAPRMNPTQTPSIQELKKTLVAAGLEIFRTRPDAVHLAERPRPNQILDAGIAVKLAGPEHAEGSYELRVVLRCQRSDFPRETPDQLWNRVRELAQPDVTAVGYDEVEQRELPVFDPGDKTKTLDTWYELVYSRVLPDVETAIEEAKRVLPVEKFVKGGQ
jgi:hypothetical protein